MSDFDNDQQASQRVGGSGDPSDSPDPSGSDGEYGPSEPSGGGPTDFSDPSEDDDDSDLGGTADFNSDDDDDPDPSPGPSTAARTRRQGRQPAAASRRSLADKSPAPLSPRPAVATTRAG